MKVIINGQKMDLHYSFRIYYLYENHLKETEKEMGITPDLQSISSVVDLLHSALENTARHNKLEMTISKEDTFDIIDENGGMNFINEFSIWFAENAQKQMSIAPNVDTSKVSKKRVSKKK